MAAIFFLLVSCLCFPLLLTSGVILCLFMTPFYLFGSSLALCCTITGLVWASKNIPSLSLASGSSFTYVSWWELCWKPGEDSLLTQVQTLCSFLLSGTLPPQTPATFISWSPKSVSSIQGNLGSSSLCAVWKLCPGNHLICFSSFGDYCPVLPDVQCLQNLFFIYFV